MKRIPLISLVLSFILLFTACTSENGTSKRNEKEIEEYKQSLIGTWVIDTNRLIEQSEETADFSDIIEQGWTQDESNPFLFYIYENGISCTMEFASYIEFHDEYLTSVTCGKVYTDSEVLQYYCEENFTEYYAVENVGEVIDLYPEDEEDKYDYIQVMPGGKEIRIETEDGYLSCYNIELTNSSRAKLVKEVIENYNN